MISKFVEWFSSNKVGASVVALAIGGLIVVSAMQGGCSLGDHIKVQVPKQVQSSQKVPDTVTLNEAVDVREAYQQDAVRALTAFDSNIERADRLRSIFSDLLNTGFTVGSDALGNSGLPMGGALALALGAFGGLFIEKPGTKAKLTAAENAGYDQGRVEAIHTVQATTNAMIPKAVTG